MASPTIWYGSVYYADDNEIWLYNGTYGAIYTGYNFTYSNGAVVGGTLTGYIQARNISTNNLGTLTYTEMYSGEGFSASAATAYYYIQTAKDPSGFLTYVMSEADIINGSLYNDVLIGFSGNDTIYGNSGADYLYGISGNDSLLGGDGDDLLVGGEGNDYLIGGAGTADCAGYSSSRATYSITNSGEYYYITDSSGVEGTDTVIAAEYFMFNGTLISATELIAPTDTTAPTVSTFSPADGASSVSVGSNIVLTFNESVAKGTGSIQLRAGSATGTVFETFDAATSSRLTFSGSTLTIDPTNSLAGGTNYYVTLANGSVKDTAGNSFTGTSTYDFNTLLIFSSSAANESFSGDSGANTLICRNSAANYTLTETDTGWLISSTADGKDTLINVERLQFTDSNLALDTAASNSAGGIYRLYKAALDRNPDLGGLGYWIAQADAGTKDAVRMATDFTYADEFKTLYGVSTADNYMTGEDITALVTKIYENVLDRAPDAGGRDYYVGQITTKSKTVGQVLAEISDSAENKLAVADLIGTGIEYTPWID